MFGFVWKQFELVQILEIDKKMKNTKEDPSPTGEV